MDGPITFPFSQSIIRTIIISFSLSTRSTLDSFHSASSLLLMSKHSSRKKHAQHFSVHCPPCVVQYNTCSSSFFLPYFYAPPPPLFYFPPDHAPYSSSISFYPVWGLSTLCMDHYSSYSNSLLHSPLHLQAVSETDDYGKDQNEWERRMGRGKIREMMEEMRDREKWERKMEDAKSYEMKRRFFSSTSIWAVLRMLRN